MKTISTFLAALYSCCLVSAPASATTFVTFANSAHTALRLTDGTISPSGQILTAGTFSEVLGTGSTATFGIGPASVRVELLAGATPTTMAPILIGANSDTAFVTNTANTTLASAQGTFPGGAPFHLPAALEFDGSAPVYFKYRAWSIGADNALSFAARLLSGAGFAGESGIIAPAPQASPALTTLFGPGPDQWQDSLLLYTVVPEPTAFTLLGLGLVAAGGFRRGR